MKKIFVVILVVALTFTITGAAMAGGPKPPKQLCISASNSPVLSLGIKKGNKFRVGSEKFDMYTVQGIFYPMPVNGTGYMNGDIFIFNLSSSMTDTNYDISVYWDVVNENGVMYVNKTDPNNITSQEYDNLQSVPCDLL